jgi:hypothetical protein
MEVPPLPATGGPRPYNNPNPRLFAFFDIPGARERHQSARVNGVRTGIEPMEIQQVPFKTVNLRIQDPGNVTIVLWVRDIDTTLARVKKAGYPVVSTGGITHTLGDGTRAVIVRDVDNRFLELRERTVGVGPGPQRHRRQRDGDGGRPPRTAGVGVFGFTMAKKSPCPTSRPGLQPVWQMNSLGPRRRATRSYG